MCTSLALCSDRRFKSITLLNVLLNMASYARLQLQEIINSPHLSNCPIKVVTSSEIYILTGCCFNCIILNIWNWLSKMCYIMPLFGKGFDQRSIIIIIAAITLLIKETIWKRWNRLKISTEIANSESPLRRLTMGVLCAPVLYGRVCTAFKPRNGRWLLQD